jgi:flagellar hook-length control protein FliK
LDFAAWNEASASPLLANALTYSGSSPTRAPQFAAASPQPSVREAPGILSAPSTLNAPSPAAGAPAFDFVSLRAASSAFPAAEVSTPSSRSASLPQQANASANEIVAGTVAKADSDASIATALDPQVFNAGSFELSPSAFADAATARPATDRTPPSASSLRAAHATGAAETAASPLVSLPPVAAPLSASGFAPAVAAAPLPQHLLPPAASNPSPTAREPFTSMDMNVPGAANAAANTATNAAIWTRTGAHSVEAGFDVPSLGWVGVRADLAAGQIHAALLPASADAAQALGSQMPGLHAYLNEQRTPVSSLSLAAPESGSAFSGADAGAGNQQNRQQNESTPAPASAIANPAGDGARNASQPIQQVIEPGPRVPLFERSGAYISVLA